MKKTTLIILALICLTLQTLAAQHLKIDVGVLSTRYSNKVGLSIVDYKTISPAINLGVDYFERNWLYLSSQVGYTRIGGVEKFDFPEEYERKELSSYIHLNTNIRAFVRKRDLTGFIGLGPYLNFLIDNNRFTTVYYQGYEINNYFGTKTEAGFHFDTNMIRVGITATYLYSLTPSANSPALDLKNHNLGAFFSVGYKL